MNTRELIQELLECDMDAEVVIDLGFDGDIDHDEGLRLECIRSVDSRLSNRCGNYTRLVVVKDE